MLAAMLWFGLRSRMYGRPTMLGTSRSGTSRVRSALRYRYSLAFSFVQITSLGVMPTLGRLTPVAYLIPFLARKNERWTSLRIDSTRPRDSLSSGGIVALPGAGGAPRGRRLR